MPLDKTIKKALVIGSGPIVIGQAAEFDYAGAQACRVLKNEGVNVVLVNSNPATIMTDKAMADEIYLEPLTVDTLKRIILKERPDSLLAGLGGQTGLTLAMKLFKDGFLDSHGVRLIGANIDAIDRAEDRKLFKETMEAIGEPTIPSDIACDVETALAIADSIGYPVIVRPAFTLGGAGGGTADTREELLPLAKGGLDASPIGQILVEVNPRASRTVPYISKVTGVPLIDIASKVMLGAKLRDLGYPAGLYRTPPYVAVKAPVFSFEKLTDVNSYLGPEMKSTGEVLGVGRTLNEALFKGLTAAGFALKSGGRGVFLSVDNHDLAEIVTLAKKLNDLDMRLYATPDTADAVQSLGIDAVRVPGMTNREATFALLESGAISYIVYTGALFDQTLDDYITLHRKALKCGIVCLTSLDTANALADIIAGRYNENNTELVDINRMRETRETLKFAKMEGTSNDYIFIEDEDFSLPCPESLCVTLCDRHSGVGGYGIVLIGRSKIADVRMRVYNRDGSIGKMAGNAIRCVGKYAYDNGMVNKTVLTVETDGGVKTLTLYLSDGKVSGVSVDMGKADFTAKNLPTTLRREQLIDHPLRVGGREYLVTCLSVGNPHCVVFTEHVDTLDLRELGPLFENAPEFPERINTEFVRVVNPATLRMRAYERGNGETNACGTGACAAVVAAVEKGLCKKGVDVTVKLTGGDLTVRYTDDGVTLTGDARLAYRGEVEY